MKGMTRGQIYDKLKAEGLECHQINDIVQNLVKVIAFAKVSMESLLGTVNV